MISAGQPSAGTKCPIDGTAKTFAHLFQTHFVLHKLNGRTFYTPAAEAPPKLPTFIANMVLVVTGMDNYSLPPRAGLARQLLDTTHRARNSTNDCSFSTGYNTVAPQQVAHTYYRRAQIRAACCW